MNLLNFASFILPILVCLYSQVKGSPVPSASDPSESSDGDLIKSTNHFVDDILETIRKSFGTKLDPLLIPEQKAGFEKHLLKIRIHGEAKLLPGKLYGLSGLRRTGDAFLGPHEESGDFSADVRVGVDKITMLTTARITFLGISSSTSLSVKVDHIDFNIKASLNPTTGTPVISNVKVVHLDGVHVTLPGSKFLSGIVKFVSKAIANLFKGNIKTAIEHNLRVEANKALSKTKISHFN